MNFVLCSTSQASTKETTVNKIKIVNILGEVRINDKKEIKNLLQSDKEISINSIVQSSNGSRIILLIDNIEIIISDISTVAIEMAQNSNSVVVKLINGFVKISKKKTEARNLLFTSDNALIFLESIDIASFMALKNSKLSNSIIIGNDGITNVISYDIEKERYPYNVPLEMTEKELKNLFKNSQAIIGKFYSAKELTNGLFSEYNKELKNYSHPTKMNYDQFLCIDNKYFTHRPISNLKLKSEAVFPENNFSLTKNLPLISNITQEQLFQDNSSITNENSNNKSVIYYSNETYKKFFNIFNNRSGGLIDINSINYIPPSKNALFDNNSNSFVFDTGSFNSSTCQYIGPTINEKYYDLNENKELVLKLDLIPNKEIIESQEVIKLVHPFGEIPKPHYQPIHDANNETTSNIIEPKDESSKLFEFYINHGAYWHALQELNNSSNYYLKGICHFYLMDFTAAKNNFEMAKKNNSQKQDLISFYLGLTYFFLPSNTENIKNAKNNFYLSIKQGQDKQLSYYMLGVIALKEKNPQEAKKIFLELAKELKEQNKNGPKDTELFQLTLKHIIDLIQDYLYQSSERQELANRILFPVYNEAIQLDEKSAVGVYLKEEKEINKKLLGLSDQKKKSPFSFDSAISIFYDDNVSNYSLLPSTLLTSNRSAGYVDISLLPQYKILKKKNISIELGFFANLQNLISSKNISSIESQNMRYYGPQASLVFSHRFFNFNSTFTGKVFNHTIDTIQNNKFTNYASIIGVELEEIFSNSKSDWKKGLGLNINKMELSPSSQNMSVSNNAVSVFMQKQTMQQIKKLIFNKYLFEYSAYTANLSQYSSSHFKLLTNVNYLLTSNLAINSTFFWQNNFFDELYRKSDATLVINPQLSYKHGSSLTLTALLKIEKNFSSEESYNYSRKKIGLSLEKDF